MSKKIYPIYIRIGKKSSYSYKNPSWKVIAATKKCNAPIYNNSYEKQPMATLQFLINVEIDDKEFENVKKILELKLENLESAIELVGGEE